MSYDIYKPAKFTIGYSDKIELKDGVNATFGFPSCRWLKDGKWTEISRFSNSTGGYKPHMQRDAEKQMKKDLGIKAEEIDNDLADGFKLVTVKHSCSRPSYAVVKDPRGFCLALDESFIEDIVLKWHLGISGSGDIEGKWLYVWKNERFAGLLPEKALDKITVDDEMLEAQARELKSFRTEDLVVGKVYDMCDTKGDKSKTERVVYLGEMAIPHLSSVRSFFNYGYQLSKLGRNWKYSSIKRGLTYASNEDLSWLPWKDTSTVKKSLAVLKPWKPAPVFIRLADEIIGYDSTDSWYCDDLAGVPEEEKEHSIRFSLDGRYNDGNFIAGKDIVKRLVNESKSQDLRVITKDQNLSYSRRHHANFAYGNASRFKTMKLDTLKTGVREFLKKMKENIDSKLALVPPHEPADMSKWINDVAKWYKDVYEKSTHWDW